MFDELIEHIPTKARTNQYSLPDEAERVLDRFVEWLGTQGKTRATSQSYRSYVSKAQCLGQTWEQMTSDQRSAVRKFKEFMSEA